MKIKENRKLIVGQSIRIPLKMYTSENAKTTDYAKVVGVYDHYALVEYNGVKRGVSNQDLVMYGIYEPKDVIGNTFGSRL